MGWQPALLYAATLKLVNSDMEHVAPAAAPWCRDLKDLDLGDGDIDSIKECLQKLKDDGQEVRVL